MKLVDVSVWQWFRLIEVVILNYDLIHLHIHHLITIKSIYLNHQHEYSSERSPLIQCKKKIIMEQETDFFLFPSHEKRSWSHDVFLVVYTLRHSFNL